MDNTKIKPNFRTAGNVSPIAFRILLIILWSQSTLLHFITAFIERLPIVGTISEFIIPCAIVVSAMLSIPIFLKNIRYKDVIFYAACVGIVFATMTFLEKNSSYVEENAVRILVSSVPFYFIGLSYSHEESKKDLFWVSLLGVAATFAYQIYSLMLGRTLISDNMHPAYIMLPSVLYLIYYAFDQMKIKYWLLSALGITLLFVFGTRGPILCIAIYILAEFVIRSIRKGSTGIIVLIFAIVTGAFLMFLMSDAFLSIIRWLSETFEAVGFGTRIFDMFLEGEISHSNGRDILHQKVIEAIWDKPFLGYGFMGDRVIIDTYVHNIALEFWCSYGLVIGTILLVTVFVIPTKALIVSKTKPVFHMILLLSCMMLVKMMLSVSYAIEPYFYLLLGVSISAIRRQHNSETI